ncbi:hypothetical protein EON83_12595 [bacterium]|nr:MAG: hypothetical protein EON83_12595 [bacterium]
MFIAEARLIRAAVREGINVEVYQRSSLPKSGRLKRSVRLKTFRGGFVVVLSGAVAPHARYRLAMKGRSKLGGHQLDVNPARYARRKTYLIRRALKRKGLMEIIGRGG